MWTVLHSMWCPSWELPLECNGFGIGLFRVWLVGSSKARLYSRIELFHHCNLSLSTLPLFLFASGPWGWESLWCHVPPWGCVNSWNRSTYGWEEPSSSSVWSPASLASMRSCSLLCENKDEPRKNTWVYYAQSENNETVAEYFKC